MFIRAWDVSSRWGLAGASASDPELPEMRELHPQVGDYVFVIMEHDKQGRLRAKLAGEQELAPLAFHAPESWKGQWFTALVYKPLQMGTFVIIDGGVIGFGAIGMIHSSERTRIAAWRRGESSGKPYPGRWQG